MSEELTHYLQESSIVTFIEEYRSTYKMDLELIEHCADYKPGDVAIFKPDSVVYWPHNLQDNLTKGNVELLELTDARNWAVLNRKDRTRIPLGPGASTNNGNVSPGNLEKRCLVFRPIPLVLDKTIGLDRLSLIDE